MSYPLLSVTTDLNPVPAVRKLNFEHVAVGQIRLGEAHSVLALASDGQLLALRYMQTGELFDLIRRHALHAAMVQLRERSTWAYLLLDGVLTPTASGKTRNGTNDTGYDWAAIQGALTSVQETGVAVITLQGERYLGDTIYTLAKRDRSTKRLRPPREALFVSPGEDVLLALPGIGEERCAALLRYAGSAGWALDLLTDPAVTIPGISARIKADARTALGLADDIRLAMTAVGAGDTPDQELSFQEHTHDRTNNRHNREPALVTPGDHAVTLGAHSEHRPVGPPVAALQRRIGRAGPDDHGEGLRAGPAADRRV